MAAKSCGLSAPAVVVRNPSIKLAKPEPFTWSVVVTFTTRTGGGKSESKLPLRRAAYGEGQHGFRDTKARFDRVDCCNKWINVRVAVVGVGLIAGGEPGLAEVLAPVPRLMVGNSRR